jgi:hypothetical protein
MLSRGGGVLEYWSDGVLEYWRLWKLSFLRSIEYINPGPELAT